MLNPPKLLLVFMVYSPLLHSSEYSYSSLVKRSESEQVKALAELRKTFNLSEETQFQPLEGGLTRAKLYSFEMKGKKYVLRFLALGPNQPEEMRQNEIKALKIGNQLEISPECTFADQNAVLMVMPFIEGHPLEKPNDQQLLLLGKVIRKLHDFPGSYPTRYVFLERLSRHYEKGLKTGIAYPSGFDTEIQSILKKPCLRPVVPSHGDLNPSNFLVNDSDNTIHIIDWTSATLDDPFADLTYICLLSNLSPVEENLFLTSYFGREPSKEEYAILKEGPFNLEVHHMKILQLAD